MNYYSLSQPPAVLEALEEFKNHNDPIRAFWAEMRTEFVWDLLPWSFLYQAYCGWMEKFMRNSKPVGRNKFIEALAELVEAQPEGWWDASGGSDKRHRSAGRMDHPEPIIAAYKLEDWCDPTVVDHKKHPVKYSTFPAARQASVYRGLLRRDPAEMAAERAEDVAAMCEQAGITVTPQEPKIEAEASGTAATEAPEAADATASPTTAPFTGPPAPGWGGQGITAPVGTAGGPVGSPASHPDGVDP